MLNIIYICLIGLAWIMLGTISLRYLAKATESFVRKRIPNDFVDSVYMTLLIFAYMGIIAFCVAGFTYCYSFFA